MANLSFRLILQTDDASGKLQSVGSEVDGVKKKVEESKIFRVSAEQALATIRDVKIAVDGVVQAVQSATRGLNDLMDANLKQRQAMQLASLAFGSAAKEMAAFASSMQAVTNFGDEDLIPLMAKLSTTYKLGKSDVQDLTMSLLDFTEANKATGMTVETAFDLMGRALNGHTEMLGRYGIELDKNRISTEGVSYLVQKLNADYGGTAKALANLRIQNANTWGDIREEIGGMIEELITPLLRGVRALFDAYMTLNPIMKGFVTGLVVAIPVIGTATTAIIALTAAVKALHIAINPVVGLIGLAVTVLAGVGFAFAAAKLQSGQFEEQTKDTTKSVEDLVAQHRAIAMSIDYVEAKRRLAQLDEAVKQYQKTLKETAAEAYRLRGEDYRAAQERRNQEKAAMAEAASEAQALRERIAHDDAAARVKFNQEKLLLERKSALSGIELLEYTLNEARNHYKALGTVTADNVDQQLQALETIRTLEKQISKERETEIAKRASDQDKAFKEKLAFDLLMHEHQREQSEYEYDRLRDLAEAREQFHDKDLELAGKTYDLQLIAIDRYYDSKREKLVAAGLTEQEITEQIEMAKDAIREQYQARAVAGQSRMFGDLMKSAAVFGKKGFAVWQTLAIAQAMVDTYASATAAYKAMAGIPVVGPGLAIAAAAAAVSAGMANVHTISQQEPPKMASGGHLIGPSHSNGGILIEAEGDEYITTKDRVRSLGRGFFDFINFAPIDSVRAALAGIGSMNIPMPSAPQFAFASGGMVGASNSMYDIFASMNEKLAALVEKQVQFDIHIDPLSNDPVKVSEIADTGKIMRSEV